MLLEVLGGEESPLTPDQRVQVQSIAKRLMAKRRPELRAVPDPEPSTGTAGKS
jgi:broad specificity phosphatase PhoE